MTVLPRNRPVPDAHDVQTSTSQMMHLQVIRSAPASALLWGGYSACFLYAVPALQRGAENRINFSSPACLKPLATGGLPAYTVEYDSKYGMYHAGGGQSDD